MNWEHLQKHLEYITEEMGIVLRRSSASPNIRERNDFSCGIFDINSRILSHAEHIPVHLGSFKIMAENLKDELKRLEEGDVLILNDPYVSGTHLNDVAMITPLFYKNEPILFLANKAHHVDVGGPMPASINPEAKSLYEEGLIIPPLKLFKNGEIDQGVLNLILENFKVPKISKIDLLAQYAANLHGKKAVKEIISKLGIEKFLEFCEKAMEHSSKLILRELEDYQDKEAEGEDYIELDEEFLKIRAKIKIKDKFYVDFIGSSQQVQAPLNAVFGVTYSASSFVFKCALKSEINLNDGFYQRIEVHAEKGSLLNPIKPAPVSAGNLETSQRIADTIFKALSQIMPEKIPAAGAGTMMNVMIGGVKEGKYWSYYETIGGGSGARPNKDGVSAVHVNMTNTMNTPIEIAEKEYPLFFTGYKIREGSGGKGKYKGGDGILRSFKILVDSKISIISDRMKLYPWGLKGGKTAIGSRITMIKPGEEPKRMPSKFSVEVIKNTEIIIETPGGGGYGEE